MINQSVVIMKYLNLGCGSHYSTATEWTNLDFTSLDNNVIAHNLLTGIPFEDNSFDLVYHSHVLEHFSKEAGETFIEECFRVLKPNGILRIAIPDLEQIVRLYLKFLEEGLNDPKNVLIRSNYDWMLIEMLDQIVRNKTGGNMKEYLFQETLLNEDFVFSRIGEEAKDLRNSFLVSKKRKCTNVNSTKKTLLMKLIYEFRCKIKRIVSKIKKTDPFKKIGEFRMSGEIHQWMYDRYSLTELLKTKGGDVVSFPDAFSSSINNWSNYNLDGENGNIRKPDSLFVEVKKSRIKEKSQ
jgi:predicted SAM-dependent methyltransferase